jgi:hypothetical protein
MPAARRRLTAQIDHTSAALFVRARRAHAARHAAALGADERSAARHRRTRARIRRHAEIEVAEIDIAEIDVAAEIHVAEIDTRIDHRDRVAVTASDQRARGQTSEHDAVRATEKR